MLMYVLPDVTPFEILMVATGNSGVPSVFTIRDGDTNELLFFCQNSTRFLGYNILENLVGHINDGQRLDLPIPWLQYLGKSGWSH